MASTPSGTAVQNSINGGSILYTDTGSYGVVASRTLTVFNYLGSVLQTFNMGSNLTQTFTFTSDDWFWFQCVVSDNVSGSPWTANVYITSDGFYWNTYGQVYNASNCGCANTENLVQSQLAWAAAMRATLAGPSGAAQAHRDIVAANVFVNESPVIKLV